MEVIISLLVVAFILYFLFSGSDEKQSTTKPTSIPKEERILNDNSFWMEEKWALARKESHTGDVKSVPIWFFDEVTDRQIQKIEEIGIKISGGRPTKGQASDIIGLFEPAEDENIEILKFFKISLKDMNQSKARYEVNKLLQDPEKSEKWRNRPATVMQKEFYKFFGLKVPQGLTHEIAKKDINEYREKLNDEDETSMDEWDAFEDIYDEINDPDFRDDYELKSINISLYRLAIANLQNEGKTLKELSDDVDIVIDKIMEIKPEIKKA